MNIKDVENPNYPEPRLVPHPLELMFERQIELSKKYAEIEDKVLGFPLPHTDTYDHNLDDPKVQFKIKEEMWRVTEELGEAANCLKNKPWKQTQVPTDREHYEEELADAFHFFLEVLILSGIDAKKLYELYFKKSEVNKFRQRSQY